MAPRLAGDGDTVPSVTTTLTPCPIPGAELRRLTSADAGQVTVLQRCCWVDEAMANEMWTIPPLTETVEDVAAWLGEQEAWGLWRDGRLLAMVRANTAGDEFEIGRLGVVPDLRGHGLGHWMLDHIEAQAGVEARRLTLFTGARSEKNIRAYESRGYRIIGEWRPGIVLLEKSIGL